MEPKDDNFAQSTAWKSQQLVMFQTLPLSPLVSSAMHSMSADGQVVVKSPYCSSQEISDADGGGNRQNRDVGTLYCTVSQMMLAEGAR